MTNPISNNLLGIAQGILVFIFTAASIMKLSQPREKLIQKLTPLAEFSQQQIRLIGLAEFFGVLGLILAVPTGILPILTPIAALCLAVLMLGLIVAWGVGSNPYSPHSTSPT